MDKTKKGLGWFLNVIVTILGIVLVGLYVANVNQPYYQDMKKGLLVMLIIAVLLSLVPLVLPRFKAIKGYRIISNLEKIALPALIIYAGIKFLAMRVESFGYIFASNLEAGNKAATAAGTQAIVLLVFFIVTWLISVVSAFVTKD